MVSGHAQVQCPFCKKVGVRAFHKPSYLEHRTSRISAGSKTKYYRVPESYEIMSGCPRCGKSLRDIQRAFDSSMTRNVTHEEGLKRFRDCGLPTRIMRDRVA